MGSTREKADGLRGGKRQRKKKGKREGRVSGFALAGNTARVAAEPGSEQPGQRSGERLGPPAARHRGTPEPLPHPAPPEIRAGGVGWEWAGGPCSSAWDCSAMGRAESSPEPPPGTLSPLCLGHKLLLDRLSLFLASASAVSSLPQPAQGKRAASAPWGPLHPLQQGCSSGRRTPEQPCTGGPPAPLTQERRHSRPWGKDRGSRAEL